jgi:hypothetical protein
VRALRAFAERSLLYLSLIGATMAQKIPVSAMVGGEFPIVIDLPTEITNGIGRVVAAHAVLENRVQELLFDAMKVDYPQGRVAFENYRDPAVLFGIIRKLFDSWGIQIDINLQDLETDIRSCTRERNILAHGVWVRDAPDRIALRVTEGQFTTEAGIHVRAFLPETQGIADDFWEPTRTRILQVAKVVIAIQQTVKPALSSVLQTQADRSSA